MIFSIFPNVKPRSDFFGKHKGETVNEMKQGQYERGFCILSCVNRVNIYNYQKTHEQRQEQIPDKYRKCDTSISDSDQQIDLRRFFDNRQETRESGDS